MKRTILTIVATMAVTLTLLTVGAFLVAPLLNREASHDSPGPNSSSSPIDYTEGHEQADRMDDIGSTYPATIEFCGLLNAADTSRSGDKQQRMATASVYRSQNMQYIAPHVLNAGSTLLNGYDYWRRTGVQASYTILANFKSACARHSYLCVS